MPRHAIAVAGGNRDNGARRQAQSRQLSGDFSFDLPELAGIERHAIHLVDDDHHLAHAEEVQEIAVATGLVAHALGRVDEQHGGIGLRRSRDHVAEELGMSGRVDQDDIARRGAQPDLTGVDGDALIALGLQGVEQERPLERHAAARAHGLERVELAVRKAFHFVQQAADQGRFAVIDMADDDDAHQGARASGRDRVELTGYLDVHGNFFFLALGGIRADHAHR